MLAAIIPSHRRAWSSPFPRFDQREDLHIKQWAIIGPEQGWSAQLSCPCALSEVHLVTLEALPV